MDGNRRWAQQRSLPVALGHKAGADRVRALVNACAERGIPYLTIFAFSTENWRRPGAEVAALMLLLRHFVQKEVSNMVAQGVRLRVLGDRIPLPPPLQSLIESAEEQTAHGTRIQLNVAINYGGQSDIVGAVKAWQAANPSLGVVDLTPAALEAHLSTTGLPDPDLLVRTGGESRISNFLIWQMAYTELYFTSTLWPDFDAAHLDMAINSFRQRERRFGGEASEAAQAAARKVAPN